MEITEVRVFPVEDEKLKAFVSIILDNCFVISDIKIINGPKGLFISMPSKKRKDGTFRDIAHPLNSETRKMMEEKKHLSFEGIAEIAKIVETMNRKKPLRWPDPSLVTPSGRTYTTSAGIAGGRMSLQSGPS